ncbi:peptidylprolyl isomerase [Psychroserpens sp.]|uniref:peptidylprolyl isomerase n=1 Tax=Psychroserpens sp. TaxID=2020870 RepID=UPI001B199799|nr:peptidylprolyl isomerase [Psychroserpens sp.]MBO6607131.1 peptidylprolyl isomerase [Psychroserpens sp.]MBO6630400.1 peptidylprolyl isomerase [Psychroserpens sp.]MBO6654277.1 peptidylprolyl isomerase [Psychroserpens sp.]MBO6682437.1 peptidylprolyl isomerase [Psychroserpens sp.]MBO6750903.1 peptidylprolyl isomerase [Psychroserpens sp.]
MRFIWLTACFLLFLNCEDKQSQQNKTTTEIDSSTVKVDDQLDTKSEEMDNKDQPFLLTKDNAMEFFLQYDKKHKENKVRIVTDFGNIDILLFNETKFHRSNFIYLTKKGYFDNTQFYRVIDNYIVQGGSTDDREVMRRRRFIGKYLLPTDTKRGFRHDRGVISMPSSNIDNPYKLASPYEFFITLRDVYELDGDYTIFGKVIRGIEVADKIAQVDTDDADWPLQNVYIRRVEILD